jgi:hypothetical protein
MRKTLRQIVAFGGGGFSMESGNPLLDDYVLGLAAAARPKVCFLPSASGDADHYIVRFYRAFSRRSLRGQPHLALPPRAGPEDLRAHLLSQDLIYVGGGSVVSLLGVWRAHGIDAILREAWERGSSSAASRPARSAGSRGGDRLPRRAARVEGSGCCRSATASTTSRLGAGARLPRLPPRRDARRLRGRGRRRAALRRHRAEPGRRLAPEARGYRLDASASGWSRCGSPPTYLGDAAPPGRRCPRRCRPRQRGV